MRRLAVFFILFVFWVVFSGHFDALHLALGVACSGLVSLFSADLLFSDPPAAPRITTRSQTWVTAWRFLRYAPWLVYQIVVANLHMVYLVFRPSALRPEVVRFRTYLSKEMARVTLANSITLTPGTVTMDIDDREFTVHAVSPRAAQALRSGEMERRVGYVFLEPAPGPNQDSSEPDGR